MESKNKEQCHPDSPGISLNWQPSGRTSGPTAYININSYLKSYQQAVDVNSFEDSDEDIWKIIMLSEWLLKNG